MPKVFISHSTLDRDFIEREIATPLRQNHIDFWYSKNDIHATEHWPKSIVAGMEACEYFLVVMSPQSAESEWVQDEVHWAMERRAGKVIPVLMEACDPLRFHI